MAENIHYLEHTADVIAQAMALAANHQRFVLVAATEIKGGSARELGTLAVVSEAGEMFGYLSNGCIDRDIQAQALEALSRREASVLRYGAGSPFLDLTLPCGGSLTLLLDPSPDIEQLAQAHERLLDRQPAKMRFVLPQGDVVAFEYAPKPRLVLAGRGSVFRAVAQCGHAAGFEVGLLSPEQEDLRALAPLAPVFSRHLVGLDDGLEVSLDTHCAFLTLFHDHDWEPRLLLDAVQTPARFIGCLGSRRTHAQRCDALLAFGAQPENIARIEGPIGLVPSLRQAPLIAISALAHITQAFPCFVSEVPDWQG